MPKIKIKSSFSKRFKVRGSGSIKRRAANRNHILTKKGQDRKRSLRCPSPEVSAHDLPSVIRMLWLKVGFRKKVKKVRRADNV
jgi:large subunit ribosomal protein L35